MMLMHWALVIFSLLWSHSHGCNQNQPVDLADVNTQKLLASMDNFAALLIQRLIFNPQMTVNVVISPMSIYASLALVLFGAAGKTQTELIQTLGFPADADFQLLQQSFRDILLMNDVFLSEMINSEEYIYVQAHIAEGLFIQQDFQLVKEYAKFLNCLNIMPQFVDFINNMPVASNRINQWIIDNNPKSDSIVVSSGPGPGTMVFITSLFYFTGKWKENLFSESDTETVPFYTLNNFEGGVDMMRALTSLYYYDDNYSFTAVEIPYAGDYFTAIFMLPYSDPVQFVTNFSVDQYKAFLQNAYLTDVDCQIPKFSSSYSMGLKESLQAMGIQQLFESADLSNMVVTNQNFVAEVTHNAKIVIDENGTTAVALTTIGFVGAGAPPEHYVSFIANRPFLMLIRNVSTNTISFATFFHRPTK